MSAFRFLPMLLKLEDRATPSVSPSDAFGAGQFVALANGVVTWCANDAGTTRTQSDTNTLAFFLTTMAEATRSTAVTLSTFQSELQTQIATNPSLTASVTPFITWAGVMAAEANQLTGTAAVLAQGYGASPLPPLAPPPSTTSPPATNPNLTTANDSGLTNTIPDLTNPNFVTQSNGLRIWNVQTGSGTAVTASSTITAWYTGYLTDGTVFDQVRSPSAATTFQVSGLIPGFQQGVIGMQPGGIRILDIPSALAYGAAGSPPKVPANAELVFEVKLASTT